MIIGTTSITGMLSGFIGGQLSDIYGHARLMLLSISLTSYILIVFYLTSIVNPLWLILISIFFMFIYFFLPLISDSTSFQFKKNKLKSTILIGLILLFIVFYIINKLEYRAMIVFFYALLNLLLSIATTIYTPPSQAIISQFLSQEKHNLYFQLRYTIATIAYSFGPLLVAILGITATSSAFLFAGIISTVYLLIASYGLFKITPTLQSILIQEAGLNQIIKTMYQDKRLIYIVIAGLIFFFGQAQFSAPLSLFLVQSFKDGLTIFTMLLIVNPIIVFISQPIIVWLCKDIKITYILISGSALNAIAFLVLGFYSDQLVFIVLAWVISSIGETIIYPYTGNLIDQVAPIPLRGSYFGAYTLSMLGMALGSVVGCAMVQLNMLHYLFILIGFLSVLMCFLFKATQIER